MSVEKSQTRQLDSGTRREFRELLYGSLIGREYGHPNDKSYILQETYSGGDSLRVTVHRDAIEDTPLDGGDEVTQHYFEDLGIVILDLNPEDEN